MDPTFLSLAEVLEIHKDQLKRYGGAAGIRDIELLKSALAMPAATYAGQFLHTQIHEMAAAYLFHIVRNYPFNDGNKRTGTVAALIFLLMNGFTFGAPEEDLAEMVLGVAWGGLDKTDVAVFLRRYCHKA